MYSEGSRTRAAHSDSGDRQSTTHDTPCCVCSGHSPSLDTVRPAAERHCRLCTKPQTARRGGRPPADAAWLRPPSSRRPVGLSSLRAREPVGRGPRAIPPGGRGRSEVMLCPQAPYPTNYFRPPKAQNEPPLAAPCRRINRRCTDLRCLSPACSSTSQHRVLYRRRKIFCQCAK